MRIVGLILLTGTLFIFGCKKVDKFTQFEMEYNEDVSVPSSTTVDLPFNILCPPIESNSESTFEVNDTRKDLVEQIKVISLDLTLLSPDNSDFSFLESIQVFISADGLSETSIASKSSIPDNVGKSLSLELSGADLQEYIKQDHFSLRLNTKTDKIITSEHSIRVHSKFFVDAKVLGQ